MENKVVLIVENSEIFKDLITQLELDEIPITVETATSAINTFIKLGADVAVVDVDNLDQRGGALLQEMRRNHPFLPIIVLSQQGDPATSVYYFQMGADDFLRKPFDAVELASRIKAKLRLVNHIKEIQECLHKKNTTSTGGRIRIGAAEIDLDRMVVHRNGQAIMLTPKEAGIIRLLYQNKGKVVMRSMFLKEVWFANENSTITDRVVDTNIVSIREKIGDTRSHTRHIKTIFGVGYLLIDV